MSSRDKDLKEKEKEWGVEIERRARRALAGESQGTPWEEVKRRIEEVLAQH